MAAATNTALLSLTRAHTHAPSSTIMTGEEDFQRVSVSRLKMSDLSAEALGHNGNIQLVSRE